MMDDGRRAWTGLNGPALHLRSAYLPTSYLAEPTYIQVYMHDVHPYRRCLCLRLYLGLTMYGLPWKVINSCLFALPPANQSASSILPPVSESFTHPSTVRPSVPPWIFHRWPTGLHRRQPTDRWMGNGSSADWRRLPNSILTLARVVSPVATSEPATPRARGLLASTVATEAASRRQTTICRRQSLRDDRSSSNPSCPTANPLVLRLA